MVDENQKNSGLNRRQWLLAAAGATGFVAAVCGIKKAADAIGSALEDPHKNGMRVSLVDYALDNETRLAYVDLLSFRNDVTKIKEIRITPDEMRFNIDGQKDPYIVKITENDGRKKTSVSIMNHHPSARPNIIIENTDPNRTLDVNLGIPPSTRNASAVVNIENFQNGKLGVDSGYHVDFKATPAQVKEAMAIFNNETEDRGNSAIYRTKVGGNVTIISGDAINDLRFEHEGKKVPPNAADIKNIRGIPKGGFDGPIAAREQQDQGTLTGIPRENAVISRNV